MSPLLILLVALSILCDVTGQIAFKRGINSLPPPGDGFRPWHLWRSLVRVPWLWFGIAVYAIELDVWLAVLSRLPLSFAFPLASLNFCGILLASRFLLHEPVSKRRWWGAALITLGVILVGIGGT